jgi:hypothetical protein
MDMFERADADDSGDIDFVEFEAIMNKDKDLKLSW